MAAFRANLFLAFVLCFGFLHGIYGTDPEETDDEVISNMKRVKNKIFKDYDKDVRPESHHNHTTSVHFCIVPQYLIELDEKKSLISIESWLVLLWKDKRLSWNSSEFDGITRLSVADHRIWQPDIRVYNAHSSNIDPMKNTPVLVYSSGWVAWVPQATVKAFCDVTTPVGSYPHDPHICNITFGSWTYDGWQIDLNIHERNAMHWDLFSNTNPRWDVDIERSKMFKVEAMNSYYSHINALFTLKRRPPTEMRIVWVFCILVMTLTLSMFCIPSNSAKKITLGASLLIILTLLIIYCAAMTPSPRTPLLAVSFVQSTMIAVTSALFLEIIVINLSCLSGPRKPPDFLVRQLSGSLGDYMCICVPWRQYNLGDKMRLHENTEETNAEPTPQQEWLVIATSLDRILFVVYAVIFAALQA